MSGDAEPEKRDRGILSKADRDYLLGEKDLSEQGERDTRYRIRNRIKNGILDFDLFLSLRDKDRELIFDDIDPISVTSALIFFFDGIIDRTDSFDDAINMFEEFIRETVLRGLTNRDDDHIIDEVTVDIQVEKREPDLSTLLRKYRDDEESLDELQYLLQNAEFDGDEELLSIRMLKRIHESAGLSDDVKEGLLSDVNYDDLDNYFAHIDNLIVQEVNEGS